MTTERDLAEEWGVADLYEDLRRVAGERGISFEEALVGLRDLVFDSPEVVEPDEQEKAVQPNVEVERDARDDADCPEYLFSPEEQEAAWAEAVTPDPDPSDG